MPRAGYVNTKKWGELREAQAVAAKDTKEHKGEYEAWRQPESLPACFIRQEVFRRNFPLCPFVPLVVKAVWY